MSEYAGKQSSTHDASSPATMTAPSPGKRTRVEEIYPEVQRRAAAAGGGGEHDESGRPRPTRSR